MATIEMSTDLARMITSVLPIGNGGTGQNTALMAFNALAAGLGTATGDFNDTTYFITTNNSGATNDYYRRSYSILKGNIKTYLTPNIITSIAYSGNGNAVTALSLSSAGVLTVTKGATYNNYSLPLATSSVRGGVKIGYTTDAANRNYAVQLSNEQMYVNVPWTDHDHYAWTDITGKPNRAGSDSDGGPAQTVKGAYTSSGGKQNPNYFGTNKVGFLMMNTTVNNNSHYKDWIIMDCYSGNDVGGGVAFGVNRQALGAYIMRSAAARTSWEESAELIGTHNYTTYCPTKTGTGASGTWGISITGTAANATNATSATYVKDRTNSTASYLNYGASGLAASAISWLCCWNGYEIRAISKAEMANAVDGAHKWVRIGGDTMTGSLHTTYKSGSWVNSLTNAAISLDDAAGSYGGWICGPTKDGRITISTYQNSDNYIYLGYGERGRTTNSFATSIRWDGPNNILYTNRQDMNWLRVINDSSNNSDDAMVYLQNKSSNDWAVKINCTGYDYGIQVTTADAAGNAITTNGVIKGYDIRASRYVYTTYTNQSCGVEDGIITNIIYDNGDGWLRKASYAHLCNNLQSTFLRYNGWWTNNSGQNVNNALGMTFTYTSHGAPAGWGTTVTFEYQYNSGYRLQLHGEGYNGSLWWRSLSSDRGGWTTWLAACPLLLENGYYGLKNPTGANDWIRTTNQGIIPYQSGGAGGGHSSLGTSSWYFSSLYVDNSYAVHTRSSGRAYMNEWIEFSGVTGLYCPNGNGAHWYPNNVSSYGTWTMQGSRGGYTGIHLGPNTQYMTVMGGECHNGLYCQNRGRWIVYYNEDSDQMALFGSSITSGYGLTINASTIAPAYYTSGSPGSNCYLGPGNGDGNGNGTANIIIRSWYGVGFMNGCTTAGTNGAITAGVDCRSGHIYANAVHNAVWNDYAECRQAETTEGGYCVTESKNGYMIKTTQRLMPACKLTSDTYGNIMGETEEAKTPIAVAGRVLVYTYQPRENYELGDAVCSAPNGTVDIMTREEIMMYPERIVGTVSEIPDYEIWHGGGKYAPQDVEVNGRIWIYVR